MADTKITGLTELTSPANNDLLVIVDDPSGSPVTKKITASNFVTGLNTNSVIVSAITGGFDAVVNTKYFLDVSGLVITGSSCVIPTGTVGSEIEINLTVGDDSYELIIVGDDDVTINGGTAKTEWSRLFITGEALRLVATTPTNWQVVHDGRIPCHGRLALSGNDTTNTAAAETTPTWDVADINVGNMADLVNYRFNIRRAGYYTFSGGYNAVSNQTDQKYRFLEVYQNAVLSHLVRERCSGASNAGPTVEMSPKTVLCAVSDFLLYVYGTEIANEGIAASPGTFFEVKEV